MENASKALLLAAGILLGIMVISFGTYLYTQFGNYSKTFVEQIEQNKVGQFNSNFLDLEGREDLTVYEIVSAVNLAKYNNEYYYDFEYSSTESGSSYRSEPFYISVKLIGVSNNFEAKTDDELHSFIKNYGLANTGVILYNSKLRRYRCVNVDISEETGYISSITFEEI